MNRLRQINWTYVTVKTVVLMFMGGAAGISFGHIVDVSLTLGLTWESWTVPFFIDGLAILGLVGRTDKFSESTKRAGLVLVSIAGSLSLAANVYAGDNLGQRFYGALVVAGFALAEWYAGRLKAAPVAETPITPRRVVTEQERAARKRAGYDKMTPAEKRDWTRNYQQRRRSVAPTSPGMVPVQAPTIEQVKAAVR